MRSNSTLCAVKSRIVVFLVSPLFVRGPRVTMARDAQGVLHVSSSSTYGLFSRYGYAVATDRLYRTEISKRSVKGIVSEVFGADCVAYPRVDAVTSSPTPSRIRARPCPRTKRVSLTELAGMNNRIDEVLKDAMPMPKLFIDYSFQRTKWTPVDVAYDL